MIELKIKNIWTNSVKNQRTIIDKIIILTSLIIGQVTLTLKLKIQIWYYWTQIDYVLYVSKTDTTRGMK